MHPFRQLRTRIASGTAGLLFAGAAVICAATGCGTSTPRASASSTANLQATSTTTVPRGSVLHATDADNGRTVHLAPGEDIVVTFASTFWQPQPLVAPGVLEQVGQPVVVGDVAAGCQPGFGCGSVTETFRALGPGEAAIIAVRGSCGEAKPCSSGQNSYRLTVEVP